MRFNFFVMSGLRQAVAMGIVFFSFHFLLNGKAYKFVATVMLASFFHASALLFLITLQFTKIKIRSTIYVILLSVGFLIIAFLLPDIHFEEDMAYSNYLNKTSEDLGNLFSFLITTLAFLFIHLLIKKNLTEKTNLLYNLSLFAFLLSLMGVRLTVAYRISMYFGLFMPILMTNLMYKSSNKSIFVFAMTIAVLVVYIITGVPVGLAHTFFWQINPF